MSADSSGEQWEGKFYKTRTEAYHAVQKQAHSEGKSVYQDKQKKGGKLLTILCGSNKLKTRKRKAKQAGSSTAASDTTTTTTTSTTVTSVDEEDESDGDNDDNEDNGDDKGGLATLLRNVDELEQEEFRQSIIDDLTESQTFNCAELVHLQSPSGQLHLQWNTKTLAWNDPLMAAAIGLGFDTIKATLLHNKQPFHGGSRVKMLERFMTCQLSGFAILHCTICGGFLNWNVALSIWVCSGMFSASQGMQQCQNRELLPRIEIWVDAAKPVCNAGLCRFKLVFRFQQNGFVYNRHASNPKHNDCIGGRIGVPGHIVVDRFRNAPLPANARMSTLSFKEKLAELQVGLATTSTARRAFKQVHGEKTEPLRRLGRFQLSGYCENFVKNNEGCSVLLLVKDNATGRLQQHVLKHDSGEYRHVDEDLMATSVWASIWDDANTGLTADSALIELRAKYAAAEQDCASSRDQLNQAIAALRADFLQQHDSLELMADFEAEVKQRLADFAFQSEQVLSELRLQVCNQYLHPTIAQPSGVVHGGIDYPGGGTILSATIVLGQVIHLIKKIGTKLYFLDGTHMKVEFSASDRKGQLLVLDTRDSLGHVWPVAMNLCFSESRANFYLMGVALGFSGLEINSPGNTLYTDRSQMALSLTKNDWKLVYHRCVICRAACCCE